MSARPSGGLAHGRSEETDRVLPVPRSSSAPSTPQGPVNLADERVLTAVRVLRQIGTGPVFQAAYDWLRTPPADSAEEIERRYRVSQDTLRIAVWALRQVETRGLAAADVAAFGEALFIPDGIVAIICAAGLSAEEIADLVEGRVRLDAAALAAVATARGYRLPPTGAQGTPPQ